jgi:hypothetical protein
MDDIRTGCQDVAYFFAQTRKVSRQNRWGNQKI